MGHLHIAPIVEGHGEFYCIRLLLERICRELLDGAYIEVLKPIRRHRTQLVRREEIARAVSLASQKLADACAIDDRGLVLLLIDADEDPPCILGPELLKHAQAVDLRTDVACVLANVEYETWFVAAAESLAEYLDLSRDQMIPDNPEAERHAKGWIERRFKGGTKYVETQDQPSMTAAFDLSLCRRRSPSFDKLCRELAARIMPHHEAG